MVHQSDCWVAVELLDVGFWYWFVISWVRIPTFDAALPDTGWFSIIGAIVFYYLPPLVHKPFLGVCVRDNCRGWSSYSSSLFLSELLYSDSESSSLLEALPEEILGESSSEAESVKRAATDSAEYSLDLQKY